VIYFDHVKMDAAFAKGRTLVRGRSGQAEYSVVTALNKGPNEAKSHDLDTDPTYVTDGNATIVTGGTPVAEDYRARRNSCSVGPRRRSSLLNKVI
jgi:hypothetical protein